MKKVYTGLSLGALAIAFIVLTLVGVISKKQSDILTNGVLTICSILSLIEIFTIIFDQGRHFVSPFFKGYGQYFWYDLSRCLVALQIFIVLDVLLAQFDVTFTFEDIAFTTIVCCLTDIGAFVIGKAFGKHKVYSLSLISPNKTVEGFIGGFLIAVTVSTAVVPLFYKNQTVELFMFIPICSVMSILGDLLASHFKRCFNAKDSNENIMRIPILKYIEYPIASHGGYLDRMDSISMGLFTLLFFKQFIS